MARMVMSNEPGTRRKSSCSSALRGVETDGQARQAVRLHLRDRLLGEQRRRARRQRRLEAALASRSAIMS